MLADWFSLVSLDWRPVVTNFSLGAIRQGLPERAMTRDLDWGVPVPLDDPDAKGKVLFVWFDAPIGYVSFTAALCARDGGDWQRYKDWWQDPECKIIHFIGEDNIVFHALTWPAMILGTQFASDELKSIGSTYQQPKGKGYYQLPTNVVANAFLNIKFPGKEEEKISKSRGTAVWISDYLNMFDPDPLRYYLTINAPENARTAWSFEEFVSRNNDELIAKIGNFVNRWQKIATQYFERKVPDAARADDTEKALLAEIRRTIDGVTEDLESTRYKSALTRIRDAFIACDRYIDGRAPWKSCKTDLPLCAATVNTCIQAVRTLGVLLGPFLPFASEKIRLSLNVPAERWRWPHAAEALPAGHALGPAPEVLFKKIELSDFAL